MKKLLKWSNIFNIEAIGKGPIPFEAKWSDVLAWILNQPTSPWKLEILSSWGPGSELLKVKAASLFKFRDPLKARFSKVLATLKAASLKVEPVFEALVFTVMAKDVLVSPVTKCYSIKHISGAILSYKFSPELARLCATRAWAAKAVSQLIESDLKSASIMGKCT